eukprot:XP_002262391.1 SICA antigen [Plasmodium knowlesi strain H]
MAPTAAAQGGGTTSMFQEWLQHLSSNGKLNANENITEQLKENLMTTWADLQSRLKATEPQEVKELCAKVGKLVNHGGNEKDHYLKNICKAIVIIKYFISGVDAKWDAGKDSIRKEVLTTEKAYPRCIVGAVAMSELYGDHCKLKEVIEEIESAVNDKLEDHLKKDGKNLQDQLNNCTGVDLNALLIGKAILGDTIKNWKQEERVKGKQGNGEWKAWVPWVYWQIVCGSEKDHTKLQQQKEKNKEVLTEFSGMDKANTELMNELMSEKEILTLEDVRKVLETSIENGKPLEVTNLMNKLDGTIKQKQAEVCMKQDGNSLCDRLKCAKDHWKLTDGKGQPEKDFWNNSVQVKLTSLFSDAITSSIGTPANHCDNAQDLDTANKAACNHITALLSKMNTTTNGTNQLSEQIIKCALLNAYAKKLKDEAKEKGYCDIDKGLQEAFSKSSTIMQSASSQCNKDTNGPNSCFQCNWNNNDELKNCRIDNGSSPKEEVKEKVELLLKDNPQTKQEQIQQTVTEMHNKSTLCERVKCALNWYEKKNGHTEMWKKVEEEVVQPLGQAMSSTAAYGGTHCDHLDNKNKEMCLLFAKGLHHMYKETNDSGNDATKLFKRTMMCAALNAYAKKLKDDAARKNGKGSCDISGGIDHAFGKGKDIMGSAAAQCQTGNSAHCFECTQDQSLENCSINTSGGETQEVKDKLTTFLNEEDTGLKESLDKICLPCLDKENLCERAECVIGRWKANGNSHPTSDPWDDVKNELKSLSEEIQTNKGSVSNHCTDLDGDNKEACLLIASGLKSIYEIKAGQGTGKTTRKELEDQLFKRTMRCVLLNAFADKLEKLPCADEKNVKDAITKAFNDKNKDIKNASDVCKNDGDKCFKCERYESLASCLIGENSNKEKVKGKVEPMLEKYDTLKKESLEKTICKPCTGEGKKDFCQELNCVVDKWGERKNGSSSGTTTWENMKSDFETELKLLLEDMKGKQTDVAKYCKGNGSAGWEDGAAGEANKKACLLTAAGLHHISNIQLEYNDKANPGKGHDNNPYDNQEFKQFASCLMLKAVAQKMKEESKICDIDQGIRVAFLKAKDIKKEFCKNNKPCIVCKLEDNYDTCTIGNSNVKNKLESLLTDNEHKDNVNNTLSTITKTEGNVGTLCQRLQCLASRVQLTKGKYSADDFWGKEGGEVANLWKELAQAMTDNGGQDKGGQCGTMDDGSAPGGAANGRPATDPEKKACNYLYAGLKALYTTTASPSSSTGNNGILSQHPSLGQTMGCLLLKEYAKKMQSTSTCVIDSGLKRAFDTAGQGSNGVQCKWNEADYDDCQISTTKASGPTTPTPVKDKLDQVKIKIDGTATDNLTEVNKMNNLCDYIRCAAPKWFKNKATAKGGNSNQTWCDFWEREGVRPKLEDMFKGIESDGKNKPNTTICQQFGDDNPHSVERKACNHITAGLEHIKTLSGSGVGVNDNQLLDRAVGCIALNMYADKIIEESNKFCPIDEERINLMFKKWNEKNKLPSSCSTGSGNNNVCFECTRHKDFNNCKLSVDKNLIKTTQSGASGTCTSNATEVKTQMGGLLNNEDKSDPNSIKSNITTTLSFITEMTSSFCTQVQCAIKKRLKIKNGQATSSGTITQPWKNIEEDATKELTKLLEHMMQPSEQKDVDKYCKDNEDKWNKIGHKEGKTNKAACLLFASGLKHIYTRGKGQVNGSVNGPSFAQTMGCLFLKEYAKQFQKMAEVKKQGNSWVHPLCDIDKGIKHAFDKSGEIMNDTSPCKNNGPNSCFVCTQNGSYKDCSIGNESVKDNVGTIFQDDQKQKHMQQTLENTVCPILLTDLLTPFLPLAPVSIGLSAMAYYLWKYFGPLGKGGARFRRSPAEIRGPSVQEQVLDHVQQDSSHEYRLVKERKPRSAPTRTKRSGPVNRRTIIEIHFEVLDECQKGDTQLNQKDFLELLVQEFMGSEFMEEEQVPKEDVLMEPVPMELVPIEEVPMERVPSLGSGLLV